MTSAEKLQVLKQDLQQMTTANDILLTNLLELAAQAIKEEGIILVDGNIQHDMIQIQYAAFLFKKRFADSGETGIPRYLRWQMNNLLFSQKGDADSDV